MIGGVAPSSASSTYLSSQHSSSKTVFSPSHHLDRFLLQHFGIVLLSFCEAQGFLYHEISLPNPTICRNVQIKSAQTMERDG